MTAEVRRKASLPGARVLTDGHVLYWWVEILLIVVFYIVYSAIRNLSGNSLLEPPAHALEHAKQIISLEQYLGIFQEHRIQDWAEHFTPMIVVANYFYGSLHFVVTIFAGVFLYRRYSDDYPRFRNALGITTTIALIGFTFYPLTPPRLLHMYGVNYGFSDTLAQYPTFWSFNSGGMKNLSNQFAAMPSVHIAWATWCAFALAPRLKSTVWRVLATVYPFFTLYVIVITGNHFFLDAVGGWIIFGIGWVVSGLVTRAGRHPQRSDRDGEVDAPRLTEPAPLVTDRYDLDHIALAAPDIAHALRFLTGELGGTIIFGGESIGFRPMQVWLGSDDGDGMPIELLEPWNVEQNDFLARFVTRHGAGPHHLTFKVASLRDALERVRTAGFHPVNIDVSDPEWKEAFLLPREAHGTVVQLAESHGHAETKAELIAYVRENGPNAHPRWWVDPAPATGKGTLRRVVLRTPALTAAVGFFAGVLQGDVERETDTRVDLVWPGLARIGLEEHAGATPGVDRLEIEGLAAEQTMIGTRLVPL